MRVVEESVQSILTPRDGEARPVGSLLHRLRSARNGPNGAPLSDRQLRDEVVTMITAGHETTAVALAWAWHSIASHEDVAETFYQEVDEVVGRRRVTATDLPRLTYTRRLILETLRLYPPVWLIARVAVRNGQVGRYRIPAKSNVLLSPFVVHRREDYWPNPTRFDPGRFAGEQDDQEAGSYFPFLAGRHLCLGKHFALIELCVVLVTIAQKYRIHLADEKPPGFEPLISLRMRDKLAVTLTSRSPALA
jgi:cytochrome P450